MSPGFRSTNNPLLPSGVKEETVRESSSRFKSNSFLISLGIKATK